MVESMSIEQFFIITFTCCLVKEYAENMESPSAGALLLVTLNNRLFACVRHDFFLITFVDNYTVVHAQSQ